MRISTFFCVLALPLFSLTAYQEPKQILLQPPGGHPTQTPDTYPAQTPGSYPAPSPGGYPPPDANQKQPSEKEGEIADRRSNEYEYNLYDRQQNRIDNNRRDQELGQQYYYQQSAGQNDTGTQYNRTKKAPSQFFNPIGDD
jgi:hypothetical protein